MRPPFWRWRQRSSTSTTLPNSSGSCCIIRTFRRIPSRSRNAQQLRSELASSSKTPPTPTRTRSTPSALLPPRRRGHGRDADQARQRLVQLRGRGRRSLTPSASICSAKPRCDSMKPTSPPWPLKWRRNTPSFAAVLSTVFPPSGEFSHLPPLFDVIARRNKELVMPFAAALSTAPQPMRRWNKLRRFPNSFVRSAGFGRRLLLDASRQGRRPDRAR